MTLQNNKTNPNARAFQRHPGSATIRFRIEGEKDVFSASLENHSKGGIGFITRYELSENSLIHIASPAIDLAGSNPVHSSEAQIIWQDKYSGTQMNVYKTGSRWLSVNCDWCNKTVPFRKLYQTNESICLCSECIDELETNLRGQLRTCMHNYLLGNIL